MPKKPKKLPRQPKPPDARAQHEAEQALDRMAERVSRGLGQEVLRVTRTDGIKLSAVLGQLVHDYAVQARDMAQLRELFQLGAAAWNMGLEPPEADEAAIEHILKRIVPAARDDVADFLREMAERKRTQFAEYEEGIFDVEVTGTMAHCQITVLGEP